MVESFVDSLPRVGVALLVLVVGVLVARGVRALLRRYLLRSKSPSFATVISKMVGWIVVILVSLLAITIVFPSVRPVDVLTSLGFVSIAVGFAFQDILENLLAGVLLLFREPFRSGDEIAVAGHAGTVKRITIRETEIRTFDGRKVLIPNADVYKNALVIQTAYESIRSDFIVGVAYEADLDEARRLIEHTLETVEGVRHEPPPEAQLRELGTSTVNIEVRLWCDPRQHSLLAVTDRAIAAVKRAMDDAGIEMPSDIIALQATSSFAAALQGGRVTPGGNVAAD
jgi:small-conductance mechanosensitive channel